MKSFRKLLYLIPFALLAVGCSKKNTPTTTKPDDTTKVVETTEKKYNIKVNKTIEDAATITGTGSFVINSSTTITIELKDGYTYDGLYNGENKITDQLSYKIETITEDLTLRAEFSAITYNLAISSDDSEKGEIEAINGQYACGSTVTLKAYPKDDYILEGWYINGEFYNNEATTTYKIPAEDIEIVAKFVIKTFTITITDNIGGKGLYYIGSNEYTEPETFEIYTYVYYNIDSPYGYYIDKVLVNKEESGYSDELSMDKDYEIEVIYDLETMYFYLVYDNNKLLSNGIRINGVPDYLDQGEYYGFYDEDGDYRYVSGYYKYMEEVTITLRIKTDYNLVGLLDSYENEYVGTISKNDQTTIKEDIITLTITNENMLVIECLGREIELSVTSADEATGTVTGGGKYHYGDKVDIKATPVKGYRFDKWVNENGITYFVGQNDDITLLGNATYIAHFVPDEFNSKIILVSRNKTKEVQDVYRTYLTEYEIPAPEVSGYTFAGWLENEDITSLFSTESTLNYTMINEDSTIYAYYTPNSYNVTYNLDGGTCSETGNTLTFGDSFSTLIPTKENYVFMGYNYFHEEETFYYDGTSSQIGYYIARLFGVNPSNVDGIIDREVIYLNGTLVTSFDTMVYGGNKVVIIDYVSGDKVVNADGTSYGVYGYGKDSTFIAIWGALVTKKYNDGTPDETNSYYLNDTVATYGTPERPGYKFLGWYVDDELYVFSTKLTHNITIEAKWEIIDYTVKLEINYPSRGEITTPITMAHIGDELTITVVAGDVYTFEYWYCDYDKQKYYDPTITYTMPASNIKFTAYISAYIMYISPNDNLMGSVEEDSVVARPGQEVAVKAIPAEGYGFEGWKYNGEIIANESETTITMPNSTMVFVTAVFGKIVTDNYERLGNKVWFGYYPQTCLNPNGQAGNNADLIEELKKLAGDLPTLDTPANYEATKDSTEWINYDYYIYPGGVWNKTETVIGAGGTSSLKTTYLKAPHMWYIDIDYDGDGRYDYRGVLIYSYRTDEIKVGTPNSSTDKTHQDDNFYTKSTVYSTYWFKYERVEWDIISNNDGTYRMVANLAIDSQNFSLSSNSYASSYIRDFLNDDFYNTAFNDLEKSIMNTMTIGSNNDFVTILTQEEVETIYTTNSARITKATDYAQSQNAYVVTRTGTYNYDKLGDSYWLTRSAAETSQNIYFVSTDGSMRTGYTYMTSYGIRPVIAVTL